MKKLNEVEMKTTEKDIKIYEVRRVGDMTEGRGGMVTVERFKEYGDAVEFIRGKKGVMGRVLNWESGEGGDWEIKPVLVKTADSCDMLRSEQDKVEVDQDDIMALLYYKDESESFQQAADRIKKQMGI